MQSPAPEPRPASPRGPARSRRDPAPAVVRERVLSDAGLAPGVDEERFARITRLAARLLDVPMAMINLVEGYQWTKAAHGIAGEPASLEDSICRRPVETAAALEVSDLAEDERFARNVFVVRDPHLRFYAARPLAVEGLTVGTLCVMDSAPRSLSEDQRAVLDELAGWAEAELNNESLNAAVRRAQEQQRLTDLVLLSAGEGIVGCDSDGVALFANPAATAILGRPESEVVGRSLHDVAHPLLADGSPFPAEECETYLAMTRGESLTAHATTFVRGDGTTVEVEQSVAPMREGGGVVGSVVTFRDVSARSEMERLKSEFIGVVSHELRTPLTSIRGSLALLRAGVVAPLADTQVPLVQMALSNAERLGHLVDDILDIERLDAGRMPLRPEPCDLGALAGQVVDLLQPAARTAEVELVSTSSGPAPVHVDSSRVTQALTNLVGNAVKFTPAGGTVTVSVSTSGSTVRADVIDTGPGIPADRIESVFDRFVQVDGAAGTSAGSGLGLTIARGIVERSNGRLMVTSEVGAGSTFSIELPHHPMPSDAADRRTTT